MPYRTLTEIFADKVTVVNNPQVTLTLSADDWALYSDSDSYEDTRLYANREIVAVALNDQISNAINTSPHRSEAFTRCICILERYRESGAADTEGREVLWDILNLTYGLSD
jgi:PHD/YefM family antitoxin component YafN of YafNO toxin-antitoxin module